MVTSSNLLRKNTGAGTRLGPTLGKLKQVFFGAFGVKGLVVTASDEVETYGKSLKRFSCGICARFWGADRADLTS